MEKRAFAIIVGGGPAPGINGVISAATIEAINRGHAVFGIHTGFKRISQGDKNCVQRLEIPEVSTIHRDGGSILGTSRANPRKSPEMLQSVVRTLNELGAGYLITIGGDDTASSAKAVAGAAVNSIAVAHVPKTIDNDLPLPGMVSTFGFQSAREVGTGIVETLMVDARTTNRWYLVIAMGRKAGHLALGIGISSGATLTIIPEDFGSERVPLTTVVDIIVGSIVKRIAHGKDYGVAVLAEGLIECVDPASIPEVADAERDPHGNIRFAELDAGGIIKRAVRQRLQEFGLRELLVVDKNVGYELRCRPPIPFDREYTRELGYGAVDFLCSGGTDAMITLDGQSLKPIAFSEFIDADSGRARIRMVDTTSSHYKIAREYQIRLSAKDLDDTILMERLSGITKKSSADIRKEFAMTAARWGDI